MKKGEMKKIGKAIVATASKIDNWSPTTCPLGELQSQLADLEQIEDLVVALSNRATYLRGVLAARMVSELSAAA